MHINDLLVGSAKPIASLLTTLQSAQKKAAAEAELGLFDLQTQINGEAAFVRRISLEQSDLIQYAVVDRKGRFDMAKAHRAKPLLIAAAVVTREGVPLFANAAAVNLSPELGEVVWEICAHVNRYGAYRDSNEYTGETEPGN